MLLKLYFWLDRRLADLPFTVEPLPVSRKSENKQFTFVVKADSNGLGVEFPHEGRVLGAFRRLLRERRNQALATHLNIIENCCDLFRGSSNPGNDVSQAGIRQIMQRDLFKRLHQVVEVLHVSSEDRAFAFALRDMRAVRGCCRANDHEQLLDHGDPLKKVAAVLLSRNSGGPVDRQCREDRLCPGGGRRPPAERLAENLEGVAVEGLGHCDRLSMVEGKA